MAKKTEETRFFGIQNFPVSLKEKIKIKAEEEGIPIGMYLIRKLRQDFK